MVRDHCIFLLCSSRSWNNRVSVTKPTNNSLTSYQCINVINKLVQLDEDRSQQLSCSERRLSADFLLDAVSVWSHCASTIRSTNWSVNPSPLSMAEGHKHWIWCPKSVMFCLEIWHFSLHVPLYWAGNPTSDADIKSWWRWLCPMWGCILLLWSTACQGTSGLQRQ